MHALIELITQYGVLLVFGWVLVEQAGLPIPAFPLLVVAGSLAATGEQSLGLTALAAVLACVIADFGWYAAGSRYGARVLRGMCRLSLTPDGCVAQTESVFDRWGARSLIVAKFIPGFATVATAMAGATQVPRRTFIVYDAVGALVWASSGLALGWVFSDAVERLLDTLVSLGRWGLVLVAALLALYLARKAWDRFSSRDVSVARLSVQELNAMLQGRDGVLLVDVRQRKLWEQERIHGASTFESVDWTGPAMRAQRDAPVVVYCDCPSEVSAVIAYRKLRAMGFRQVFPLAGGLSAWRAGGYEIARGQEQDVRSPPAG